MRKKIIAAVAAGVLALVGVVALVIWAQGANDRAFEGADLIDVVRVTAPVAAGTTVDDLAESVETASLPSSAVPEGAVTDLAEVQGLATTAALQPGEVLLSARLGAPGEREDGAVDVPKGTQELTFNLDDQRVVGGAVKAGDRVAVMGSFTGQNPDESFTNLVAHDVLVTRVAAGTVSEEASLSAASVTVAVNTQLAEKIVFTMEFGKVWLTLQNPDTEKSGQRVIGLGDLR